MGVALNVKLVLAVTFHLSLINRKNVVTSPTSFSCLSGKWWPANTLMLRYISWSVTLLLVHLLLSDGMICISFLSFFFMRTNLLSGCTGTWVEEQLEDVMKQCRGSQAYAWRWFNHWEARYQDHNVWFQILGTNVYMITVCFLKIGNK